MIMNTVQANNCENSGASATVHTSDNETMNNNYASLCLQKVILTRKHEKFRGRGSVIPKKTKKSPKFRNCNIGSKLQSDAIPKIPECTYEIGGGCYRNRMHLAALSDTCAGVRDGNYCYVK